MNAPRYYVIGYAGQPIYSLMREEGKARVEICRVDCVAAEELERAFALANAGAGLLAALVGMVKEFGSADLDPEISTHRPIIAAKAAIAKAQDAMKAAA